ncbi:MAG: hypothetical protein RLZZ02_1340 [Bacteroidota bacterium]|jgi:beta-glucosidase
MKTRALLVLMLAAGPAFAQKKPVAERVDSVLALMTLEEKVGQMNQYNGFWNATGPAPAGGDAATKYTHLRNGWVGSVLNVQGVEEVRAMQKVAVEETRLGIPLIFACDVIHGYKTLSPIPLAEAASWDMPAIAKSAQNAAAEATSYGLNWTFAPMVDVMRDPRWGRVMEGAGEDPFLVARVSEARIQGFQGDDLASPLTMAACAKHFAGYGFSEGGRDYNTVDVSQHTLHTVILPPFEASAKAGVATFMNSFNTVEAVPATGNQALAAILKDDWSFDGVLVSDWGSIGEMRAHGYSRDLKEAAMQAANARCDMDMESLAYVAYLAQLVREGKVTESIVDDAVRRVLKLKFDLGLMDDPYKYCNRGGAWEPKKSPWAAEAQEIAEKSAVLLKNDGILPIAKGQKVALIGPFGSETNSPLGNWRVSSDDYTAVSLEEGLQGVLKGKGRLTTSNGPVFLTGPINFPTEAAINTTDTSGMAVAVRAAKQADVVLLAVGEHGFQSGEGRSRMHLGLPGLQEELVRKVLEVQSEVVLVLYAGRPMILPKDIESRVKAILLVWQPGTMGGPAIANLLVGKRSPSGRLPMTFPREVGQIPLYYGAYSTGRPGPIDEVFWSHYTDGPNGPAYPFGYGLTYSKVDYGQTTAGLSADKKAVEVRVQIWNAGGTDVDEVVQVYVRDHHSSIAVQPVKRLVGFERVSLPAGATKTIVIQVPLEELHVKTASGSTAESGAFTFWAGPNSGAGSPADLEISF